MKFRKLKFNDFFTLKGISLQHGFYRKISKTEYQKFTTGYGLTIPYKKSKLPSSFYNQELEFLKNITEKYKQKTGIFTSMTDDF